MFRLIRDERVYLSALALVVLAGLGLVTYVTAADVACYGLLNENVICPDCPANAERATCQSQLDNQPGLVRPLTNNVSEAWCNGYNTTVAQVGPYGLGATTPCSTATAQTGYLCKPKTIGGNAAPQVECGWKYKCKWVVANGEGSCNQDAKVATYKADEYVKDKTGCIQPV